MKMGPGSASLGAGPSSGSGKEAMMKVRVLFYHDVL